MRSGFRDALNAQLRAVHASSGPVTLVGWSLGGVFVREMARHQPQCVRRVITLGSPINRDPDANNMLPLVRLANGGKRPKTDLAGFARRIAPPPVPCTAIYRSEEHTSELQSLMRISYAVFCLKKKKNNKET